MLNDLRFALRSYLKSPGFAIVAVLALALGIGANTAMFSAVGRCAAAPATYRDPGRLVMIWERNPKSADFCRTLPCFLRNVLDWKEQSRCWRTCLLSTRSSHYRPGQPEQVEASRRHEFLDMLGVQAVLGRASPQRCAAEKGQVALISYALSNESSARIPVRSAKTSCRLGSVCIAGVLPPEVFTCRPCGRFDQKKPDVWLPLSAQAMSDAELNARTAFVFGRLKDGVSLHSFGARWRPSTAAQSALSEIKHYFRSQRVSVLRGMSAR